MPSLLLVPHRSGRGIAWKDDRCISKQMEIWLDEVRFSKYFTAAIRELMKEVPINLSAYSTLSSRIAKAIYLYVPSRAVKHKRRENAWEISAGKLLEQVGAKVPKHKSLRRRVFTQHKRSIINQLDGLLVVSGEILRVELGETRNGDDALLAFWVDPPAKAIAVGAKGKGSVVEKSAKPSPVAPPAPIVVAAKPPAAEVPRKEVPAAKAESAAVKGLVEAGVMDRMAKHLVEKHGEEFVLEKLHEWPFRLRMKASKWTNPAGALIRSIQEKWERPKGCRSLAQKKAEKRREAALARKQRKLDELKEEDVGIREKCEQWWEGLGPDERADEEAKAIEAGKEDEHLKESLCGGYGQSGAQKIAKGRWALEKLGLTKRWDEIEAAMKAIRSSDTSAQSEPGGTPAG